MKVGRRSWGLEKGVLGFLDGAGAGEGGDGLSVGRYPGGRGGGYMKKG